MNETRFCLSEETGTANKGWFLKEPGDFRIAVRLWEPNLRDISKPFKTFLVTCSSNCGRSGNSYKVSHLKTWPRRGFSFKNKDPFWMECSNFNASVTRTLKNEVLNDEAWSRSLHQHVFSTLLNCAAINAKTKHCHKSSKLTLQYSRNTMVWNRCFAASLCCPCVGCSGMGAEGRWDVHSLSCIPNSSTWEVRQGVFY